jgi:hypothetical protein
MMAGELARDLAIALHYHKNTLFVVLLLIIS